MIVIVIPAKGESSRLPNKNMVFINGKPLLDYAIDSAQTSSSANAIYVSTDNDEIASHAMLRNISVIRRPPSLSGDTPIIDVYRHAANNINGGDKISILVGLQPDHPDRNVSIDHTIEILRSNHADRVLSKDAAGTKNGAHYVLSRYFLDTGESRKDVTIVDDCINIHYQEDLDRAKRRLVGK